MINFRTGSQARRLIALLSAVGEYPMRSMYLLGNERRYKDLAHTLAKPQTVRNADTGEEMTLPKVLKARIKRFAYTKPPFPYWNGLARVSITTLRFGLTDSPATPRIWNATIG